MDGEKLDNGNKTEQFKMLYAACDIADEIKKQIEKITNIAEKDGAVSAEADKLQAVINDLMTKRMRLICFTVTLTVDENRVLELRCKDCLSWKNIATQMYLGVTTVKRLYKRVEEAAEQFGGIFR